MVMGGTFGAKGTTSGAVEGLAHRFTAGAVARSRRDLAEADHAPIVIRREPRPDMARNKLWPANSQSAIVAFIIAHLPVVPLEQET